MFLLVIHLNNQMFVYIITIAIFLLTFCFILIVCLIVSLLFQYFLSVHPYFMFYICAGPSCEIKSTLYNKNHL